MTEEERRVAAVARYRSERDKAMERGNRHLLTPRKTHGDGERFVPMTGAQLAEAKRLLEDIEERTRQRCRHHRPSR